LEEGRSLYDSTKLLLAGLPAHYPSNFERKIRKYEHQLLVNCYHSTRESNRSSKDF